MADPEPPPGNASIDPTTIANQTVNYKTEEPIPTEQSVPYINQFINSTSHLLNQFSDLYESKLFEIDKYLDDVETTL